MKHTKFALLALSGAAILSACSIRQSVEPATLGAGESICVINNEDVGKNVEAVIVDDLRDKGYIVRVVSDFNDPSCTNKLTYVANWNWDVAVYMNNLEIEVFEGAVRTGEANYNSEKGGANMGKFINAEDKIRELLAELFPAG